MLEGFKRSYQSFVRISAIYFGKGSKQSEGRLGRMPVTSFRTPYDLVIVPSTSSVWDRAENAEFPVLAHPLMTRANQVVSAVEERIFGLVKPAE